MSDSDQARAEDTLQALQAIRRQLSRLATVATVMAIALILIAAGQLANVIDFHAAYPLMLGGVCTFAALVGFALGWWSRRGA